MSGFILDTSVVLKWFSNFGENDLDQALVLRAALTDGTVLFTVPELLFYELSNALRYNSNFSLEDVQEALDSVLEMGMDVISVDRSVMAKAISIAFKYDVTVYDAYFLALSWREKKPLIVADYRFAKKVSGFSGILRLSDITPETLRRR